jgi:hypothetical protein
VVAAGVLLARGLVRWVGWRGELREDVLEVTGRKVGLNAAGVVGRMKATAAAVVVEVWGLLRITARVLRTATVPSMMVRKRKMLELGKGRRREQQH